MKATKLLVGLILLTRIAFCQQPQQIRKSWIQIASEDLSGNSDLTDSTYTRYVFERNSLHLSLEPAWGFATRNWNLSNGKLYIGEDGYTIEVLNDSSLTIFLDGFKRIHLLSEPYLAAQEKNLEKIGEFEGKPLYKANKYITPRYSETKSFSNIVSNAMEQHYQIKHKSLFQASFIITEKGAVKGIKIEHGIFDDFDADLVKEIAKTSNKWAPATYKGQPIQTQFVFKIQYLDSLIPY